MGRITEVVVGLLLAILMKFAIDAVWRLRWAFRVCGSCPGRHCIWIRPFLPEALLTASFFPPKGWMGHYSGKFFLYAKERSTILSGVILLDATPMFWIADADAIKVVTSDRHTFRKDAEPYEILNIYGRSLLTSEGDEWRRHLGIAGPSFNEANYVLNWEVTHRIAQEWFEDMDAGTSEYGEGKVVDINKKMIRATLLIVSAAGFGMHTSWSTSANTNLENTQANTGVFPFHIALALMIEKLFVKVLTPSFVYALPFRIPWVSKELEITKMAFDSLRSHMLDLVESARNGEEGEANLLRRLVQANDAAQARGEGEKGTLSDEELLSNIFIFLLAGHETTAHTLSFAILLLGINPDVQKKLREEVMTVWPTLDDMRSSSYRRDFEKLEYTLAVFRETLRCFPPEPRLDKIVEADTILTGTRFSPTVSSENGSTYDGATTNVHFTREESSERKFTVHIPKGSVIAMDIWATHMSPLIWGPDAHKFRPERFIDTETYKWPRDALLAFSAGPRGCIGQRFAITESVCLLANFVRHYEILPTQVGDVSTLSEESKRRMLRWTTGITITPTNAFIRLRKHSK